MCLDAVDSEVTTRRKTGWKLFFKKDGWLQTILGYGVYDAGAWLRSTDGAIGEPRYERGFHIYPHKRDAQEAGWMYDAIKKVRFRNVVAQGTEEGAIIVVAKEMFIVKEV